MSEKKKLFCEKCKKSIDETNFYISKNLEKYPPDGKLRICKKCFTMHVNSWEPSTFAPLLKEIDVPYIAHEWNRLLDMYGKDPKKVTGVTIFGRYISKMKLKQYCELSWADTERLQQEADRRKKVEEAQSKAQLNRYASALTTTDISRIEGMSPEDLTDEDIENLTEEELSIIFAQPHTRPVPKDEYIPWNENPDLTDNDEDDFPRIAAPAPSPIDQLSSEDRIYLTVKWGKLYSIEEWLALEKHYKEMEDSFDIQGAGHKDYLKTICKTSLKMHQALDCNDIEGYAKLQKCYDSLNKSAKFTAAQNKAESGEFVDSVSELVYLAEEEGFIPRFHTAEPKDIVDATIKDMKFYTRNLVTQERALEAKIEAAIETMQREIEREREEEEEIDTDELDESLFDESKALSDEDYMMFFEQEDSQVEEDNSND